MAYFKLLPKVVNLVVLGSGEGTSIGTVVETAFNFLDLDFENYLKISINFKTK